MLRAGMFLLLALALLTACQPDTVQPSPPLAVQLQFAGQPLQCDSSFSLGPQRWQLSQLQFYLSDFQLNGKALPLVADQRYQQPHLALLGTVCDGNDNWQLQFQQAPAHGTLSFKLGVPPALNHQDPLRAVAPLNQSELFWSWQQGYKYLRLDLTAIDGASGQTGWSLHLGANGCQSASPLRAPAGPCAAPNLAQVQLAYRQGQQLVLDLAPLLNGLTLSSDNHCMADPNRLSCQQILPRLGIAGAQQIWSSQ
ncbi:MAG TPA: MbnP family copper-binding protein [Rheinheimera sp.]|nr:MbnP family copper-binding protein [Rheinheimera sp.]